MQCGMRMKDKIGDMLKWLKSVQYQYNAILKCLAWYAIIVIAGAAINWIAFLMNTTTFVISEQLNKHVERYEFLHEDIDLAAYHSGVKDAMPISLDDFSTFMKADFDSLDNVNRALAQKQRDYERCLAIWDSLSKIAEPIIYDSIKVYKDSLLHGCVERIDSLKKYMLNHDSTKMVLEGKYVELAELEYDLAKKNAQVQKYFGENYHFFIPDSLRHAIREQNEASITIPWEIQNFEQQRRDVSRHIKDKVSRFHENRRESVGFIDFLYYSICVSTTVSFGDIAPNNGTTRMLAIIELLLCIILVGIVLDKINKKIK